MKGISILTARPVSASSMNQEIHCLSSLKYPTKACLTELASRLQEPMLSSVHGTIVIAIACVSINLKKGADKRT